MESARSEAVMDGPLAGLPDDIETAAGYMVDGTLGRDGRRLRGEWRRLEHEGMYFAALVRNPPSALHYEASPDDPDDPWLADFNQRSAERLANYQTEMDRQRGVVMYALSDLSAHVDDLIVTVKAMVPELRPQGTVAITVDEANVVAMKLAKQNVAFVHRGVRDWAASIRKATSKTCSIATVKATRLWQETMKATGRRTNEGQDAQGGDSDKKPKCHYRRQPANAR